MMARFIILTALFLSGCGSSLSVEEMAEIPESQENIYLYLEPPYPVVLSEPDPRNQIELKKAIRFWNDSLGFDLLVTENQTVDDGKKLGAPPVFVVSIDPTQGRDGEADYPLWNGEPGDCEITVGTKASWPLFAHEIGHCLGFTHIRDEWSIMFPDTDEGQMVTQEIIEIIQEMTDK